MHVPPIHTCMWLISFINNINNYSLELNSSIRELVLLVNIQAGRQEGLSALVLYAYVS
jgi:hypothetical protein